MLISRGRILFKHVSALTKRKTLPKITLVRNSSGGVTYRCCPEPSKLENVISELMMGVMWWWILWHMWHDLSHITGEFDYPDPSKWTDEELGIPPDDD